jgi:hypothetical protein
MREGYNIGWCELSAHPPRLTTGMLTPGAIGTVGVTATSADATSVAAADAAAATSHPNMLH